MPLISVVVPVYKVEKYLPRCVDSILNQTFSDFELILVDDGSPDNCGKICDRYAEKDARVRVIHQENARLSAARNAGINISTGEWLALIDSDDWVHKDYLNILYSGILNNTDVVICDCLITNNMYERDTVYVNPEFKSVPLRDIYNNHYARSRAWGRLFRRSSIGDLRYISGTEPAEDACFNELLYHNNMHFRITDAKLYYYYMRSDSAIHTHMGRGTFNSIGPLLYHLGKIDDGEKRRRIIMRCYKYVFSARYGEMFTDDYPEVRKQCRGLFKQLSKFLPELGLKDRIIMLAFRMSPFLYRVWRIHDDPTLLQHEKQQRAMRHKRNEEKVINASDK